MRRRLHKGKNKEGVSVGSDGLQAKEANLASLSTLSCFHTVVLPFKVRSSTSGSSPKGRNHKQALSPTLPKPQTHAALSPEQTLPHL